MVRTSVFFATACSLLAFYGGLNVRDRQRHHGWNLVPVVVAAVDIPAGTPVTFDLISQRSMPEQFVGSRMVKPDSAQLIIGRAPKSNLAAGDVLTRDDFANDVAAKLDEGACAVVIHLEQAVEEGERIDVLFSDGSPLVSGARVLSSGQAPWLEVTPVEAKDVAIWAQRKPALTIVVRSRLPPRP